MTATASVGGGFEHTVPTKSYPSPALKVDGIWFGYDPGSPILRDVNLTVERSQHQAIIGPSGSGKTSLLRLLAGLSSPSAGTVELTVPAGQHAATMLFQQDTLLPWATAEQNVLLHARLKRRRFARISAADRDHARELLEVAELGAFRDMYPYQLSGGMRRRLALATALAPQPAVVYLDEPFSSVDEPTRIGIHQALLRLLDTSNTTMVLVTHDLSEAITLCQKVTVLSARPATVAASFDTSDVGDRSDLLALRAQEQYLHMYARIWDHLSAAMRSSTSDLTGDDS